VNLSAISVVFACCAVEAEMLYYWTPWQFNLLFHEVCGAQPAAVMPSP
jgi:hypothetical protein